MTASLARSPARLSAISTETLRDACAAPIPTVDAVPGQHDRVRPDVAHGPPGEQQVGELAERRVAPGHDLELAAVEVDRVERLDQQAAADPLEVQVRDAVVAHALGRVGGDREQLEAGLRP